MKRYFCIPALVFALLASPAALSHSRVKDAQVLARMDVMVQITQDMKALSAIVRGTADFDPSELKLLSASLAGHARQTVVEFEPEASDPFSEALPNIWTEWDEFVLLSEDMGTVAGRIGEAANLTELQVTFQELGKSCTSCHEKFRINKN